MKDAEDRELHAKHGAWRTRHTTSSALWFLNRIGLARVWHVSAPCRNGYLCVHHVVWRWSR